MILIFVVVVICIFLVNYNLNRYNWYVKSWSMPGPFALPIIGNALLFIDPYDVLRKMHNFALKYGYFYRLWIGNKLMVYISHPQYIEKILTSPETIDKGYSYEILRKFGGNVKGDALTMRLGQNAIQCRKMLNPTLQHYSIVNSWYHVFNKHMKTFEEILGKYADKGLEFDMFSVTEKCTLDMTCETTFGTEMHIQKNKNSSFVNGGNCLLETIGGLVFQPWNKFDTIFRQSKLYKPYCKAVHDTQSFIEELISRRVEKYKTNNKPEENCVRNENSSTAIQNINDDITVRKMNIFLDLVISMVEQKLLPFEDIQGETTGMIYGGWETTSFTVSCLALSLAMCPEYQEKIYEEIMTIIPDKNTDITTDHISKLELGDRFVKEMFRLYPAVPIVARRTHNDIKIGDYTIPQGTEILLSVYTLHRDKKIWGPHSNEIYPDHFLPENIEKRPTSAYMPFIVGPRKCIGYKYGNVAVRMFLFYLLRNYRFTTNLKLEDLKLSYHISLRLLNKHKVFIHRR